MKGDFLIMKINNIILKLLSLVGIVLILAGCGTAATSNENEDNTSGSGVENSGIVVGSIVPNLVEVKDEDYQYVFELRNDKTEDVTLTMNSSQYFDYHLIDNTNSVVYTYSDDKMFTMALEEKVLKPGESLQMDIDLTEGLNTLEPGTYSLEVWSTANEAKEWKVKKEIIWDGVIKENSRAEEKPLIEEARVTYVGLQDLNSIEVINELNEAEAMRLSEEVKPFFNELETETKITVFYIKLDGQKIIQSATKE